MPITHDLYQYSTYVNQINLSFHQYLLMGDEPVLFHTGNAEQAEALIPWLEEKLGKKKLKYIFVSHFESDECGGLTLILERFPDAVMVCPEVTARQFIGFGYKLNTLIKKPGEKLVSDSFELEFISYPSEMHLWEGLLAIENRRGIFFSSDIMIRFGESGGKVVDSDWKTEIDNISSAQIPDPNLLIQLQTALRKYDPSFVATGHGPCLRLK